MALQPEMELVDQLLGGELAWSVIRPLFGDDAGAVNALSHYVRTGVVTLSRDGQSLPIWESRQLLRNTHDINGLAGMSISLTEKGAQAFEDGTWESLR